MVSVQRSQGMPQHWTERVPAGSKMGPLLSKAESISDNSADTKVSEEGGGGHAPGTRIDSPAAHGGKTLVRQVVPLQPMEENSKADILQLMESPTVEQVDVP